jgi:hypothetical protein
MALRSWRRAWCDGSVFISAEVNLGLGFNAAQARLANLTSGGLLRHASDDAYRELGASLARVGPLGMAPGLSKLVAVRFGDMAVHENLATVAMRWEATGPEVALFPALDADIVLTRVAEDTTILAVRGVYRPPLGRLGAGLDRVVMRRVAQPTIRAFTHRIGTAITMPSAGEAHVGLVLDFPPRPEPEAL